MAGETYEAFRALGPAEVLARAKEAEERPPASASVPVIATAPWRRLYRDMRGAGARAVSDLKPHLVEEYAAKLGYGYFRYGGNIVFLPFEGRS